MTFAFLIYLISVLSSLKVFLGFLTVFVPALTFWTYLERSIDGKPNLLHKHLTKLIAISVLLAVFTGLVPSEKTAYMMVGGYITQQLVQSETSDKVVKIINNKLDQFIAEEVKELKEQPKAK